MKSFAAKVSVPYAIMFYGAFTGRMKLNFPTNYRIMVMPKTWSPSVCTCCSTLIMTGIMAEANVDNGYGAACAVLPPRSAVTAKWPAGCACAP